MSALLRRWLLVIPVGIVALSGLALLFGQSAAGRLWRQRGVRSPAQKLVHLYAERCAQCVVTAQTDAGQRRVMR